MVAATATAGVAATATAAAAAATAAGEFQYAAALQHLPMQARYAPFGSISARLGPYIYSDVPFFCSGGGGYGGNY